MRNNAHRHIKTDESFHPRKKREIGGGENQIVNTSGGTKSQLSAAFLMLMWLRRSVFPDFLPSEFRS